MTSILFVLLPLGKEDSYCSLSNHISLFPQIAQSQKPPAVQVCPDACLELKCSCRYKSNMQISSQFCLKMRIFIYNFSHVCEDELHGLAEMSSGCIQKHEHLKRHWKKKGTCMYRCISSDLYEGGGKGNNISIKNLMNSHNLSLLYPHRLVSSKRRLKSTYSIQIVLSGK